MEIAEQAEYLQKLGRWLTTLNRGMDSLQQARGEEGFSRISVAADTLYQQLNSTIAPDEFLFDHNLMVEGLSLVRQGMLKIKIGDDLKGRADATSGAKMVDEGAAHIRALARRRYSQTQP